MAAVPIARLLAALCLAALSAACATTPSLGPEQAALNAVPERFLGMAPITEAARGGRTVVRVFSVEDIYWPVVEYVAEPDGGPVSVTVVNVPGAFGAARMSAPVDPEYWAMALRDFERLERMAEESDALPEPIQALADQLGDTQLVCEPTRWFVVATEKRVKTPGMKAWNSCANRQGAAFPGLYGLALYSLSPCDELEVAQPDAEAVARCLRILGERGPAVALSNAIGAERQTLPEGSDDWPLILGRFGPEARFSLGRESGAGPEALADAWARLSEGRGLRIGMATYQGLSENEVEVRGEAYHVIDRDLSGRELAPADRQLWFAPFHAVWVRTGEGWTIRELVVQPLMQAFGRDPIDDFLSGRGG